MFKNLVELIHTFKDEQSCRDYIVQQRWNGSPVCPHCGCGKWYSIENGKRFKCGSKTCYKKYSVTVGTIFEASNIPLTKWFLAVYLVTAHKKGISSYQLGRDIGVAQKSAWFMLHRIREMMRPKEMVQLNNTVEMDETYVGGKLANMHKKKRQKIHETNTGHFNKTPVFGMLQRDGQLVLIQTPLPTGEVLKPIIRAHVNKDAILITDQFGAYSKLDLEFKQHESLNHLQEEYVRGEYHTNTIEGAFGLFKRGIIGIYHQITVKHLQRYCDEFTYRYNSRKIKDVVRFDLSLTRLEGRLKWDVLVRKQQKP